MNDNVTERQTVGNANQYRASYRRAIKMSDVDASSIRFRVYTYEEQNMMTRNIPSELT